MIECDCIDCDDGCSFISLKYTKHSHDVICNVSGRAQLNSLELLSTLPPPDHFLSLNTAKKKKKVSGATAALSLLYFGQSTRKCK